MRCEDHPDIARAERTGYGLPLNDYGLICCPCCGERLYHDDKLYTQMGRIIGCTSCVEADPVEPYLDDWEWQDDRS